MKRVAFVSTYPPRRCGIGTYTQNLRQHLQVSLPSSVGHPVIVMSDEKTTVPRGGLYIPLLQNSRQSYPKMAEYLNHSDVDVVSLQHEFGIFGGEAGEYVLGLVENLTKPLVTTFHTVFKSPQEPYRFVQQTLVKRSDALVVMSRTGVEYLRQAFRVPADKVFYIPHGTPVPPQQERQTLRRQLGWEGRQVILTFGLLSRGKGIESILSALPKVVAKVSNVLYVIAGQTHPEVRKREGESYRRELQQRVVRNGLSRHVMMLDRYLEDVDLIRLITACDLYATPYPGMEQITSGTLAYAVGLGRPVLSTPYEYAKDLLQGFEELLIPYGKTDDWVEKIIDFLTNSKLLALWSQRMATLGKDMHWGQVVRQYTRLFSQVTTRDLSLNPLELNTRASTLPTLTTVPSPVKSISYVSLESFGE